MPRRAARSLRRSLAALTLAALCACGNSGSAPTDASQAAAGASSSAPAAEPVAEAKPQTALPAAVEDLAKIAPKDATVVVGLPTLDRLKALMDPKMVEAAIDALASQIGDKLRMPSLMVKQVLESYDGGIVFVRGSIEAGKGAAAIRVKPGSFISAALRGARFEEKGGGRWLLAEKEPIHAQVLEQANVVIVANDEAAFDMALETASGRAPSFAESPRYRKRSADTLWGAVDLAGLFANDKDLAATTLPGSLVVAGLEIGTTASSGSADVEYIHLGDKVPRVGLVLDTADHVSLAGLPAGAVAAVGLSLKRLPGKTLRDLLDELSRLEKNKLADEADRGLQALAKVSLADLDAALGDDASLGVYYEGQRMSMGDRDALQEGALLFDITTKNDKTAAALVDAIGTLLSKEKGFKGGKGRFSVPMNAFVVEVAQSAGHVHIVLGGKTAVTKALKAATATTERLGASPKFAKAKADAPAASQLALYMDIGALAKVLPAEANTASLEQLGDAPAILSITFKPSDAGVHALASSAAGAGAVAAVGTMSALAIYGVRRYLANAKTAEAKNTIGAIRRGAMAAYERESASGIHELCRSASPVPSAIPAGRKYQPDATAGKDFETDAWKCLKFTMTSPHYFQYEYRAGGGYKGPKRGGPDPGPNGFEVSAEGDLDGDGVTSLFTLTGTVDKATQSLKVSTQIFIADEYE